MEVRTKDGAAIVTLMHRFDASTANDVEALLKDLIAKGNREIICNYSQTEYVSSAGLRVILSAAKSLKSVGGQILLASLKSYVLETFEISGFTQIFKIFDSEEEALQSLRQTR